MFTGLQGQEILYTTSFVGKVCRKILVSIRAKLLECLGWLCMTLHLSFPSMYKTRYKSTFWKIKLLGLTEAWSPRVFSSLYLSFSLSLSLSLSFSGWSLGAWGFSAFTYLPGFLRPEREDVLHLHSLGRLGGHLWPLWTGQTSCLEVLLVLYVNQGISAFFSPLFSYLQHSFLISLSKSIAIAEAVSPSGFPGSCGGWTLAPQETCVQSLGWEDTLEEEIATHSSILAWRIPWMEEPGGLQSMGSQRVRHN